MSRDFLVYWKPQTVDFNLSREGPLEHSASEQFGRLHAGDVLWITTVRAGVLHLIARIQVGRIASTAAAVRALGTDDLWEANYHVIAQRGTAQPMREIPIPHLGARLRFLSKAGNDRLALDGGLVNAQQLQTMRELTPQSAVLLEEDWETAAECVMG